MAVNLLEYNLSPSVRAFSTTRSGGISEGNYASFNITDYCGDSLSHVLENRRLLCKTLGINDSCLFLPHQTHGNHIFCIDDKFLKLNVDVQKQHLDDIDALITSIPRICIGVSTADCVPILLYDEVRKVAAAVHAGWRGTVTRILEAVLLQMDKQYLCSPQNLKVVIGPSISLDSFEIGKEVYEAFWKAKFPMESISKFYPTSLGDTIFQGVKGKWHLDLWAANYMMLENYGVPLENVQIANICTLKSNENWFSARCLGVKSGRIFTGVMIK